MRRETFEYALRRFSRAVPFEGFTVELVNLERLAGHHPEAFEISDDLVTHVERDGTTHLFDASCVARLVSVVIPDGKH